MEAQAEDEQERVQGRLFYSGLELGISDASEIMAGHYAHLIGILGSWNAGKTCLLSSLYLQAAQGALDPGYQFAGSRTLQGFEDRSRLVRRWSGDVLPKALADHTPIPATRSPALMHISFYDPAIARRYELLLTDLPGEWTKQLIDRADAAERFSFLHRADGVLIVIDAPLLFSEEQHVEIRRTKMLLQRLADAVQLDRQTPLIFVLSKCDKVQMQRPPCVDELLTCASNLGYKPDLIMTAAFSECPDKFKNGAGITEMLRAITTNATPISSTGEPELNGGRIFATFRNRGK